MDVAGISVDLARLREARQIILVEGASDKAALEVLAARRGQVLGRGGVCVVAMGGATSIGHFLALLGPRGLNLRLAGLCDAAQEAHVRAALERGGLGAGGLGAGGSRAELEDLGFYVCTADLEDELIRAAGTAAVEHVIAAEGELRSLRIFQRQPAQRRQSASQQLHRFLGTRSGRKSRYARVLAASLDPGRVPRPLDRVLAHVSSGW